MRQSLNVWPHEAFGEEFSRSLNTGVAEGRQVVKYLSAERKRDVWAWFGIKGVAVQLD